MKDFEYIKPPRLQPGDTIGLIAPASPPLDDDSYDRAIKYFKDRGYEIKSGATVLKKRGYLAGSDRERLNDFHTLYSDKRVKALIALRGGYGSGRLISHLNYEQIKSDPKIVVGYSDITILLLAILRKAGVITFSGPMALPDFGKKIDRVTEEYFWSMVEAERMRIPINLNSLIDVVSGRHGSFSGVIIGGNLSSICGLVGSSYLPDFNKAVLAIEEIDEPPHRIDRMLNQLKLAGIFGKISGVILGTFTNCNPPANRPALTLEEIFHDYFSNAPFPVIGYLPFGHLESKITLPIGGIVEWDHDSRRVFIKGPVVS